jgi:DNA primase
MVHDQRSDVALQPQILAHYSLAGPLLERSFTGDPIVFANYPSGFPTAPPPSATPPSATPLSANIAHVTLSPSKGAAAHWRITDVPLSTRKLLWCVHRFYAIEFAGWAPLATDEDRLRFARILLEPNAETPFARVREAAERLRTHLHAEHVDAAVLFDGRHGIALWIPLAAAPRADVIRPWLHAICARAVAADPLLFTTEPNTADNGRIHLHVASNAKNHFSALPYSLRGTLDLRVVTPIRWDDLATADPVAVTAATFPAHLETLGDIFAAEVARIGSQDMPTHAPPASPQLLAANSAPRGHVIVAAIEILEDGKARSADAILAEALARNLVPPHTTRKYVYTALIEYIARQTGRGRKPQVVQDAERNFRINEPPDDWPDLIDPQESAPDPTREPLIARLEATATGGDPMLFEQACCDAFAHLGFRTRRLGGHAEPDGIADAELGPLAYRMLLECKTAKAIVTQPDAAEASKFLRAFNADYGLLIGPDFTDETQLVQELRTHGVTAFTVADLTTLLALAANPLELRAILQPGFASEAIADLAWDRRHGRTKRIATLVTLIHREGWREQCAAAAQPPPRNAPHLTIDAAMFLVDQALRAAGSTSSCSRDEVALAFAHLTDPLIAIAVRLEADNAIVILRPPEDTVPDSIGIHDIPRNP